MNEYNQGMKQTLYEGRAFGINLVYAALYDFSWFKNTYVNADLIVAGLQVVVVLLEVERELMLTSSQLQNSFSDFLTVEHAIERSAELASRRLQING